MVDSGSILGPSVILGVRYFELILLGLFSEL